VIQQEIDELFPKVTSTDGCGGFEELVKDQQLARQLFHKLWGVARGDGERPQSYDKKLWGELMAVLNRLGVRV